MEDKRPRIAVIGARHGSPEGRAFAFEVGKALAEQGVLVYCGGAGGIMEATCQGVKAGGGVSIGILKGEDGKDANPYVDIPIMTGMGDLRNGIIIRSVQGVIAVEGGYGTLTEIAYTIGYDKPVVAFNSWDIPGMKQVKDVQSAVEKILDLI